MNALRFHVSALTACLLLPAAFVGCAAADSTEDEEETSASAEANLSDAKQPKLELGLLAGGTSVGSKVGKGVCASASLAALPNVRGEDLFKNVAEVVVTDGNTGWQKVISSIEVPKNGFIIHNLDKVEDAITLQSSLGPLKNFIGHAMTIQIIQKRKMNGKVVGKSPLLSFKITEPRFDLVSVQRSQSCPTSGPNGCYFATMRMYPSDSSVSADDYVCDDIRLDLSSPSAGIVPELTPSVFHSGKLESALSKPIPWGDDFKPKTAVLVKNNVRVSNLINLP